MNEETGSGILTCGSEKKSGNSEFFSMSRAPVDGISKLEFPEDKMDDKDDSEGLLSMEGKGGGAPVNWRVDVHGGHQQ